MGFFVPLQLLLLADLIIAAFFLTRKMVCSFLSSAYYPLEHYCAVAELFYTMTILLQCQCCLLSTITKSKFCREEFYTNEKLVGRGSGQTERAYKAFKV